MGADDRRGTVDLAEMCERDLRVCVSQVDRIRRAGTYREVHFLLSNLYGLMMLGGCEGGSVSGAQLTMRAQTGVVAACCARVGSCGGCKCPCEW